MRAARTARAEAFAARFAFRAAARARVSSSPVVAFAALPTAFARARAASAGPMSSASARRRSRRAAFAAARRASRVASSIRRASRAAARPAFLAAWRSGFTPQVGRRSASVKCTFLEWPYHAQHHLDPRLLIARDARMELPTPRPRIILCLDLDAFFASVEAADDPRLNNPERPLAVGSPDPRRGVISTASYAARAYGVKAGMSTAEALRRCEDLKIVVPRHDRYAEVSDIVFDICRRVTDLVEPTSVDEGFIDATKLLGAGQDPFLLAAELRRVIRAETGLAASIGIGANKRIAKIACDRAKPDGILAIERGDERAFLAPLPISVISGVGPKTAALLVEQGIRSCAELAATPADHLVRWFGPKAGWMRDAAAGIDDDPVEPNRARRSVSAEITLEEDSADPAVLSAVAAGLAEEVARRLSGEGLYARGITVKLKDADFRTITRAAGISDGSDDPALLAAAAEAVITKEAKGKAYRLVGIAATHLVPGEQLTLFGRGAGTTPAA